jgi:hypothetical protein
MRTETGPVSETLYSLVFLEYRTMVKVPKPRTPECYTPSSEPFRVYILSSFKVWLYAGFWLVNGFIDNLYTRLVSTSTYSATANLHNSQIATTFTKPFPACCVISRSLATASNSVDSSASRAQALSSQTPIQKWRFPLLITCRHGPRRNIPFSLL